MAYNQMTLLGFRTVKTTERAILARIDFPTPPKDVWLPKSIIEDYEKGKHQDTALVPDWFREKNGI